MISKEEVMQAIDVESQVVDGFIFSVNEMVHGVKEQTKRIKEGKENRVALLRAAFDERELEIKRYEKAIELMEAEENGKYHWLIQEAME